MRVLHITATHLNKYGGIPVVLENLVKFQNDSENVRSIVLSVKHDISHVKSEYFHFHNNKEKIQEFILEYNPTVVIFHGFYFKEYISIGNFLNDQNYQYFIQPHSSFMKSAQNKSRLKKMIANKVLFRNLINTAHGYIFLNDDELRKSKFRTKNDIIIPNGIIVDRSFKKVVGEDKLKIFFLGRIDIDHKGIDLLCEELKKIDYKDHKFLLNIYGVGKQNDIEILNDYIKKYTHLEVNYKGPVYDKDKLKVYEESDIMILTSRYEGFPITILEALSFGIPCIVTDGTNVKSMIEDNHLGWGVEHNQISSSVLKAVDEYRSDREYYINRTREFVVENYSWELIAKKSIALLNKV